MTNPTRHDTLRRSLLLCLAMLTGLALPASAAGDLGKTVPSLRLVPADTETYFALLRNAEQIKAIAGSRAWARLTEMEWAQTAWKEVQKHLADKDNPLGAFIKDPANQPLLDLLADASSQEIFFCGGVGTGDFLGLMQEVQGAHFGGMLSKLGGGGGQTQLQDMLRAYLETLNENKDKLKVPGLILGFRLKDSKRAAAQVDRLEKLLGGAVEQNPALKGRLKRAKVGGGSFLTLTLDGGMVPWDGLPLKQIEKNAGEFDDLIKKLKQLRLTLALGVRGDYLLLSLGESTAPLAALGSAKTLADVADLKPLAKHAEERITSVSYSSKTFNTRTQLSRAEVDAAVASWKGGLAQLDLTREQRAKIGKDLDELAKDVKARLAEPAAMLAFGFLSERGMESYVYDWGRSSGAPAPARLALLDHLGGSPLIASVGRSSSASDYKLLAKWVRKADGYIDDLLLPMLDGGNKQQVEAVLKALRPAGRRFDEVTTKMLLPSLAGGESAFVLDAKMTSKKWIPQLPNSARALALPEPAFVCAVSDAALLEKGLGEYRELFNKLVKDMSDAFGQNVDFEVPPAKTRKLKEAKLYYYQLPAQLGFDERVSPNAGIGEKVAAFSLSVGMTERLLARKPLKAGGLLAKRDRPMTSMVYVNWEGLMKAIGPWVEYGLETALTARGNLPPAEQESILKQVRTAVEILSVLRSSTGVTTVEGTATVTHYETVLRDLDK